MPLNLHNPFAEADFDRLDPTPTPQQLLVAQHVVIMALSQLGYEQILPAFQPLQDRDDKSRAFAHLSYRILGMVRAGARLEEPATVQALAGVARSVFEIVTDVELLHRDVVTDGVEKFHEFTAVERFQAAKSIVNVYSERKWNLGEIEDQHGFVSDSARAARTEATVKRIWGARKDGKLNWPRHWSGEEAAGRARLLGDDWIKLNHRLGDMLAWQIHGGPAGAAGLDSAGMTGLLVTVREVFADRVPLAYRAIAEEFEFANPGLERDLSFIHRGLQTVVVIDLKRQETEHRSRLTELGLGL
jgi:hypothetical protein